MERGFITNAQIIASSQWDANHAAVQARLHLKAGGGKQGAWSALANNQNQWLKVDHAAMKYYVSLNASINYVGAVNF